MYSIDELCNISANLGSKRYLVKKMGFKISFPKNSMSNVCWMNGIFGEKTHSIQLPDTLKTPFRHPQDIPIDTHKIPNKNKFLGYITLISN